MKVGIMFANVGPFSQPDQLAHLATSAEAAGVESLWTVEHVVVPVGYTAEYPYSDDGRMPGPENSPIPDPILPQRHPAYVAKEFATLDNLSGGRALAGIGIGWLHEEFAALGIPFEERVGRTEESIAAIRSLWKEKPEPFDGQFYKWPALESNPKPVQPGGVPIVVGGHTVGAARRAARFGDGFFPARGDITRLAELIEVIHKECAESGRDPAEIEISCGADVRDADAIKRLRDLGVSRIVTGPPGFDKDTVSKGLDALGKVIAAF